MRGKRNNEIGNRYGKLLVIKDTGENDLWGQALWACLCDCGKERIVRGRDLRKGNTKSCGCGIGVVHGYARKGIRIPEYTSWASARKRCYCPTNPSFLDYGGRGIKMCERWLLSFESFLEDVGKKPYPHYSLDRINVNGNYEPSNCRWASPKEQSNNQRRKRIENFSDDDIAQEFLKRFGN